MTWRLGSSTRRSSTRPGSSSCSPRSVTAWCGHPVTSAVAIRGKRPIRRTLASTTRKSRVGCRYRVLFEYPNGEAREVMVGEDEHVLAAARRAGLVLPSLCEQGWDLACAVEVLEGRLDHSDALRYYSEDERAGFAL